MKMKLRSAGAWLLCLILTLTACGAPEDNVQVVTEVTETQAPEAQAPSSLDLLRQEIAPAVAGIVFLGYGEDGIRSGEIKANILEKGYDDRFSFLKDMDRIVETDGYELYCIIPADPGASVDVCVWDAETGTTGDILYQSSTGEPFLLLCNVSDIMPNTALTIVDSEGRMLELYSPGLSLRDGCVYLPETPVLLDLTSYG